MSSKPKWKRCQYPGRAVIAISGLVCRYKADRHVYKGGSPAYQGDFCEPHALQMERLIAQHDLGVRGFIEGEYRIIEEDAENGCSEESNEAYQRLRLSQSRVDEMHKPEDPRA